MVFNAYLIKKTPGYLFVLFALKTLKGVFPYKITVVTLQTNYNQHNRSPTTIKQDPCSSTVLLYANSPNTIEPAISIMAPPILEEICPKEMSSILSAAPRTAMSPEPPLFAMHSPAVIAASIG